MVCIPKMATYTFTKNDFSLIMRCCYTTAASQNAVCITQQSNVSYNNIISRLQTMKVIRNLMFSVISECFVYKGKAYKY